MCECGSQKLELGWGRGRGQGKRGGRRDGKSEIGREAWKEGGERREDRSGGKGKEGKGREVTDRVGFRNHCSSYILF